MKKDKALDLILGATQSAGSGGSDVPTPAAGDTGKVLTVGSNLQPAWDDVPDELPTPASGDAGKVLTVGSNLQPAWDDVPDELPAIASADKGKFLKVDNQGKPAWAAVPAELPSHTSSDKDKMLSVNSSNKLVWKEVPAELPAHGSSDADKVLSVASDGSLVWGDAGGGGGDSELPEYDASNDGEVLTVASDGSLTWAPVGSLVSGYCTILIGEQEVGQLEFEGNLTSSVVKLTGYPDSPITLNNGEVYSISIGRFPFTVSAIRLEWESSGETVRGNINSFAEQSTPRIVNWSNPGRGITTSIQARVSGNTGTVTISTETPVTIYVYY